MLPERILEKINFELEEIEFLFELYAGELSHLKDTPNLMETTAFAAILHSFYTGIEKIFLVIARSIDKKIPDDSKWHKTLIVQMTEKNQNRPAVISEKMKTRLLDYLAFRHFFRYSYSFRLEWEELENLVISVKDTWSDFRIEISAFLQSVSGK